MSIVIARTEDPQTDPRLLESMFRLRHTVFRERLGWDVQSRNGLEMDRFDDLAPVYVLSRGQAREVDACWRLLPTTGPYMLRDVFPQLLCGDPPPNDPRIWELSRFAVRTDARGDLAQGAVNPLTFRMMQQIYDFAVAHGIRSYVTVTSVAVERMFRHVGLPLRRFGEGKAQRIGKVLSVACWIDINEETFRAVYRNGSRDVMAA